MTVLRGVVTGLGVAGYPPAITRSLITQLQYGVGPMYARRSSRSAGIVAFHGTAFPCVDAKGPRIGGSRNKCHPVCDVCGPTKTPWTTSPLVSWRFRRCITP